MSATATVVDTTGRYAGSLDLLARDVVAGFDAWSQVLAPSSGAITIELRLVATGTDRADGTGPGYFLGNLGANAVYSQNGAEELLTGRSLNGTTADITIDLNIDYAATWYWIDPLDGSKPPPNHSDLVSVFAHEIGHGLGFIGYRDWASYALPGNYETVFDSLVQVVGGVPVFTGANAEALYGGPVPLTIGNLFHLGNAAGPGADLRPDLMNGWVLDFGTTPVSRLDGAILSDLGVPTVFADHLTGTAQNDTINGGDGADTIMGGQGDDQILGGADPSYLRGEDGDDSIIGGAQFDDINGNKGQDTIDGGSGGGDWLVGGQGNDLITAHAGQNILYGNLGADTLMAGAGGDLMRGGQGDDSLSGGVGNDWLSGDRGNDTISGGAGADTFHTFSGAGLDRVLDFHIAEGDRVQLDPGTTYTLTQSGADTVIDMGGGDQMILVGVQAASLTPGWIFTL